MNVIAQKKKQNKKTKKTVKSEALKRITNILEIICFQISGKGAER